MSFDNYANYYEVLNQDKPYKKEIDFVYKWAMKPKSVLDIGCGNASYWKYYPKDVEIVGIEKSKGMIDKAKPERNIFLLDAVHIRELDFIPDFELATALFDVLNYIPNHQWWNDIPIKPGGYFIFDIFDKEKVDKSGFSVTERKSGDLTRRIIPSGYDGKTVTLDIEINGNSLEKHQMYIWSHEDIQRFCEDEFEIEEVKKTKNWQTWYKCRKK